MRKGTSALFEVKDLSDWVSDFGLEENLKENPEPEKSHLPRKFYANVTMNH